MTNRDPSSRRFDRRAFLAGGVAVGGALPLSRARQDAIGRAARTRPYGSDLGAVRHIVYLMQENRSFDHYFGSYPGVRGFDDHTTSSLGAFAQPYPANTSDVPEGVLLPFHINSRSGIGECTHDLNHQWGVQHQCWNGGAMDAFVSTHTSDAVDGPSYGALTMGFYTRADLPYHYALADAFTIGDNYHCSVLGPTDPNRLMWMSGTIDPAGRHGGPVVSTEQSSQALFSVDWTTVPELLEDRGVSWKVYTPPGQGFLPHDPEGSWGDAVLPYFRQYRRPTSPLFQRAFLPTFPDDFRKDIRSGQLPSVSWILPPNGYDEHPPAPPAFGAWFIDQVLSDLIADPAVWASTVFVISYDENDGFFDHVTPPTAPVGTPGEYLTTSGLPGPATGVAGPIGLGFRVPLLVVSPFSAGGRVVSDVLDHTSQIRLLEERFGIRCDSISPWRRATVGDLTSALHGGSRETRRPSLPSTKEYRSQALEQLGCTTADVEEYNTSQTPYPVPSPQRMPVQETRVARA